MLRTLLSLRSAAPLHGRDYYETQIGIVLIERNWMIGPGLLLEVHYWPGRIWALRMYPRQRTRCGWDGCENRPLAGSLECRDHEMPF